MEYQLNVWQLQTNSDYWYSATIATRWHVDQIANESIIITATVSSTIPKRFFATLYFNFCTNHELFIFIFQSLIPFVLLFSLSPSRSV